MQGFINRRMPLFVRRAVTMTPALIILTLGFDATSTLVVSQVVLSFGIPFALVPMVLLTRRADVMGTLVNRGATTIVAGVFAAADHRPQRLPAPADVPRIGQAKRPASAPASRGVSTRPRWPLDAL